MKLAKSAGVQYMVVTSKHHEGFCLFDSEWDSYNSKKGTPFGRDIMAGFKNLAGGEIKSYTDMMNEGRDIAESRMISEAQAMGADAIVNMRFDSSSVMEGAIDFLAYGTAVKFINK